MNRSDRGVATGWDLRGEVWTLAFGAALKDKIGGEWRGGVGLAYLAAVDETNLAPGFNQATDDGYAVLLNAGYSCAGSQPQAPAGAGERQPPAVPQNTRRA